jgi:hypothetical protein
MKEYTIGEIFRKGLLKTNDGKPYKDKASVSNVLRSYPHRVQKTAHGPAKMYTEATIKSANKRWD